MGQKKPTKVTFFQAVKLCFLAVFSPSRLIELEKEDSIKLNSAENDTEHRVMKVHNAFLASLLLIVIFSALGIVVGRALNYFYGAPASAVLNILQISGAGLLLWGTLFVRGFEIQSYACVTLSERVNQWLYRALYCVGTSLIICSLSW